MLATDAGIIDFNLTGILAFLIFLVTIVALWRLALGPISRVLEAREARIEAGLRAAEESEKRLAQVQAEVQKELEQARQQAREVLSRAHQEATVDAEEVRARARHEAEAQVEKARADIEAERDRALQELRAQLSALVVEAAGRVLGQAIDETSHRRLIDESLADVAGRG